MKKAILFSIGLFSLFSAQAQLEWAPVGAKYYHSVLNESQIPQAVFVSEVAGDTIIAGKNCRIFYTWWSPYCEGRQFTYEEAGQVYIYSEESYSFGLVFDFNKGAGESWWMPVCSQHEGEIPADSMQIFVDSVGITNVNGMDIRTQYVTWTSPWEQQTKHTKIYEGIGNAPVIYFFWGVYGLASNIWLHTFNCYESPTHGIFNFVGGQPCGVYTAADEARPETEKLLLHPNPAWELLHIQFPRMGAGQLALYDARGRLLKTQSFDNVPETWVLDVSALPTGMYLLQYRSEGRVMAVERFVKR
ncbi:MAG: T9SS type A sorting domain-containing protein [Saprospiraceae bacterium]|nr:T9SS type A sorting domain-containing protein [Saprospiraceae bacterium]